MGGPQSTVKSFDIPKRLVFQAWEKVGANGGAPGVDAVSIVGFASAERNNLYKLWNRMSSGSYLPEPVRAVEIGRIGHDPSHPPDRQPCHSTPTAPRGRVRDPTSALLNATQWSEMRSRNGATQCVSCRVSVVTALSPSSVGGRSRRHIGHIDVAAGLLGSYSGTLLERSLGLDGCELVSSVGRLAPPPSGRRSGPYVRPRKITWWALFTRRSSAPSASTGCCCDAPG